MSQYLNKQQRNDYIFLAACLQHCEDIIAAWSEHNALTAIELKELKTARTNLRKALEQISDRMAPDFSRRLLRDSKAVQIFCGPTHEVREEHEACTSAQTTCQVQEDSLYDLAEHALIGCMDQHCPHQGQPETCAKQALLLDLTVPVFDTAPLPGVCPYYQPAGDPHA